MIKEIKVEKSQLSCLWNMNLKKGGTYPRILSDPNEERARAVPLKYSFKVITIFPSSHMLIIYGSIKKSMSQNTSKQDSSLINSASLSFIGNTDFLMPNVIKIAILNKSFFLKMAERYFLILFVNFCKKVFKKKTWLLILFFRFFGNFPKTVVQGVKEKHDIFYEIFLQIFCSFLIFSQFLSILFIR